MLNKTRWNILLGFGMGVGMLFAAHSPAADTVAREVAPWWQTGSPAARAKAHMGDIHPESWTDTELRRRKLCVAPIAGQDTNSAIRILDCFATADLYHFVPDPEKFKGGLYITYEVLEPAPVFLNTDGGAAFWDFMNQTLDEQTVFYSNERWDVRKKGVFAVETRFTGWKSYVGVPLAKGVFTFTSRGTFNIREPSTGAYIGNCNHRNYGPKYPRLYLEGLENVCADLAFTVADLTRYQISLGDIVSDWGKSGYVGVVLTVKDAQGAMLDLPGAEVTARLTSGSDHESTLLRLMPRPGMYDFPSLELRHHFYGAYPSNFFDVKEIQVNARLWVQGPDGVIREEQVEKTIQRDETKPVAFEQWARLERRKDRRTPDGKLMETRIFYVHSDITRFWKSAKHARIVAQTVKDMGGNVIAPAIYGWGVSIARSDVMGVYPSLPEGSDNLKVLIEEANKLDLKVLAIVVCTEATTPSPPLNKTWPTLANKHPEWTVVNADGSKDDTVADVHRPEFRAHLCRYVAELASRYKVDGLLLDYIRTMNPCFCEKCRAEYRTKTGRDLSQDANGGYPLPQPYKDWQSEAVGALVKEIRAALDGVNPELKLCTWGNPDDQGHQGRRPDIWLNNGWIDWFEYSAQGGTADYAVNTWRQIARRVKRPECVWPNFGTEHSVVNLTPESEKGSMVIARTIFGEPKPPASTMRAIRGSFIQPAYEAVRDNCKVNGFGLYQIGCTTEETRREIRELVFPEDAVPWWPERPKP